jgi:hypothetical protein
MDGASDVAKIEWSSGSLATDDGWDPAPGSLCMQELVRSQEQADWMASHGRVADGPGSVQLTAFGASFSTTTAL